MELRDDTGRRQQELGRVAEGFCSLGKAASERLPDTSRAIQAEDSVVLYEAREGCAYYSCFNLFRVAL